MNSLTIAELKRRGMAAIEDGLRLGPLHIVKRNRPTAVVLSEDEYQRLVHGTAMPIAGVSAVQWLLSQPSTGSKDQAVLDAEIQAERASWDAV